MYAPLIISSSSQNTKGVGTYLASQWVTPQRYKSPLGGAVVEVPAGWGTGLSGCGCGGTCGGCGDHGLGDDGSSFPNIPPWLAPVGAAVAVYLIFRDDDKKKKR